MATITTDEFSTRATVSAPLAIPVKLSWGAIIGAAVVVLAGYLLLMSVGLAVGLSFVEPQAPHTAKTAAMIVGIWSAVASLVALLIGGMVAARSAGIIDRATGAIHGAVLWGVTTLLAVFLVSGGVRAIGVGAQAGMFAVQSSAATAADPLRRALGIGTEDLMAAINERLIVEGKPRIGRIQVEDAAREAIRMTLIEGRIDRDLFSAALAEHTGLSREAASDVVAEVEGTFQARRSMWAGRTRAMLLRAADETGEVMWWVFVGLALGLGAAVTGATIGVSRRQRLAADRVVPLVTPHEVTP